jgi:hypothetical protein
MKLAPFALTAAVLVVLLYLAVGAVGRAVDQRIQEIDYAVRCIDSNATDCEERTP